MDLFNYKTHVESQSQLKVGGQPLAEVLRPQTIDHIFGQEDVIGPDSKIGQLLRNNFLFSLIIWGPPGTGKTTFALSLANQLDAHFNNINATEAGVKILRELCEGGKDRRIQQQKKTILFVDEIHRFNKGQQDVLLPYIERGDVILVGATTENPGYELNRALLSRCRVVIFSKLERAHMVKIVSQVEGHYQIKAADVLKTESLEFLFNYVDGDARKLINSLELVYAYFLSLSPDSAKQLAIEDLLPLLQKSPLHYDRTSEMHYDLISAFIKSVRGSDPDAAVYYLSRMMDGGEDPVFVARRLIILASEDIGNADPRAISVAVSGMQAVEMIGMPEAAIVLSQVTTYLASCPKSNASYMALKKARQTVEKTKNLPVPLHLRSPQSSVSQSLGFGADYKYPHDESRSWVEQNYLPEPIKDEKFYVPKAIGFEKNISDFLSWLKVKK